MAVTIAKKRLWLTYANARYRFGQLNQNEPSRFIDEMPEEFIDKSYAGGNSKNTLNSKWGNGYQSMNRGFTPKSDNVSAAEKKYGPTPTKTISTPSYLTPVNRNTAVNHIPSENFEASDTSGLQAEQKVEHQKFGYGEVKKIEGSAHNPIATIHFEHNGEKKIMLNYAKLRIVE